jgi:MSHA biogenesis protein MshJ
MKQSWQKFALRIDALTLRERAVIFAVAVLILAVLVNTFLLDPQYATQTNVSQKIKQQQSQIADIQNQIQQTVKAREIDPDQADREHLRALKQQATELSGALTDLQQNLVPPNKMTELLEDVLKRNNRLLLVSLKTLPITILNDATQLDVKTTGTVTPPVASSADESSEIKTDFRHSVEITVQGNYMDMLAYVKSLEASPWKLFWGNAQLTVNEYPKSTLTLTVFTLSLDKKWLDL